MLTEKQVEARLKKRISEIGGTALKFVSPGCSGVPDRIVLLPGGRIVFVELKKPGGTLSPLQVAMRNRLLKLGFSYCLIDSYEKVEELVHEISSTQLSAIRNRKDS